MRVSSSSSKRLTPGVKRYLFAGFLAMGIGGLITFVVVRDLTRAVASVNWPSTQGKIIESSVERRSRYRSAPTYRAEVLYEFTVDGTMFTGGRVSYGYYGSSDPSHARQIVDRYPKGKAVTVYYMPDNPKKSLLEPGIEWWSFVALGFGLAFLITGTAVAVSSLRQ